MLIDTLYDHRVRNIGDIFLRKLSSILLQYFDQACLLQVRIVVSADVPLKTLFVADAQSDVDDDSRLLMDDLGISKGSVSRSLDVYVNFL